jgi:hypothetical protein
VGNALVEVGRELGAVLVTDPPDWQRVSAAALQAAVEAPARRSFEVTARG